LHIGDGYKPGFHSQFTTGGLSAHYVVYKDGSIEQWVDEGQAAYHAGIVDRPTWPLYDGTNPNLRLFGIEHEGFSGDGWTEAMVQADLWLLRGLRERHGLAYTPDTLIRHSAINALHGGCPGPGAPFDRLLTELA
jgi:N-acetylmuramoyl-L-alanine amidase